MSGRDRRSGWTWRLAGEASPGLDWVAEGDGAPLGAVTVTDPQGAAWAIDRLNGAGLRWAPVDGRPVGPQTDGVELSGAVLLDLSGMDAVVTIDACAAHAHVRAGARWGAVEAAARSRGLTLGPLPPDLAARPIWSTLADGRPWRPSPRYGHLVDALLALRCALPSGVLTRSAVAPRRATGPDLARCSVGTTPAAGLITDVHLQLHRRPDGDFGVWTRALDLQVAAVPETVRALSDAGVRPAAWRLRPTLPAGRRSPKSVKQVRWSVVGVDLDEAARFDAVAAALDGGGAPARDLDRAWGWPDAGEATGAEASDRFEPVARVSWDALGEALARWPSAEARELEPDAVLVFAKGARASDTPAVDPSWAALQTRLVDALRDLCPAAAMGRP